jgi:hypothetical protein
MPLLRAALTYRRKGRLRGLQKPMSIGVGLLSGACEGRLCGRVEARPLGAALAASHDAETYQWINN